MSAFLRRCLLVLIALTFFRGGLALALTCQSNATGNWNVAGTWTGCGGGIPGAGDDVQIRNAHTVTILTGVNAVANSLTFTASNGQALLTHQAGGTLTVGAGGVTINPATDDNFKFWNVAAGTATVNGSITLIAGTNDTRIAGISISTGTLTVSGTAGNNGDITMTNAATNVRTQIFFSGAGNLNVTRSIVLSNGLGTLTPSTGRVTYTSGSTASVAGGGAITYNNLTINKPAGTATLAANTTVAADLTVTAGTFDLAAFTANRTAAGGTISVANAATLRIGGTNGFPANYTTRTLGATSTVDYDGTNQTVTAATYGHLTLSGSGTKTIGTAAGQTVTIAGNLAVGNGVTYLGTTNNPIVNLAGGLTDNGTLNSGTGAFTFNGAAAQTISGTASGTTTIFDLRLNNANGLSLTGTHDVSTAGLTLTNGRVTTNANILYISTGAAVGGAGATRFVVGNLRKRVTVGANVLRAFEVGTVTPAVRYAPVTSVRFGSVTVAGDFTVSTTINDHPFLNSSTLDPVQSVNRYWTMTNNSVTFTANANNRFIFNFVAGDLDGAATTGSFFVSRYAGSVWNEITPSARTATTTQISGAGITDANVSGEYAIAERAAAITAPGDFNAFETSTTPNPGATTGNVYTKLVGTNFTVAVVAILSGVQHSSFTNTVQVDLVTGAAGGANCPGAPVTVAGTTQNVNLTIGRGNTANINVATAVRNARVRIRYPAVGPTVTSCSTDNFSIRPTAFTITSTNATQTGTSGAPAIKTGANVNLTASSVAGYDGTPSIDSALGMLTGTPTAGTLGGVFNAAPIGTGVAQGNSFFYSEVGNFGLSANAVFDSSFTAVDQPNDCNAGFSNALVGGKYGCSIGSAAVAQTTGVSGFGRFIPDNFDVALTTVPIFGTACGAGSFTYVGQTFTYPTAVMTVTARQGTANGLTNQPTLNYAGAYMKLSNAAGVSLNQAPFDTQGGRYTRFDALGGGTTPALATSGLPATTADPAIGIFTNGVGTLTFSPGTGLSFTRTTPTAAFNADIRLALNVVDTDSVAFAANPASFGTAGAGNGIAFSSGKAMRFGRLVIANRNGSQLVPLQIPIEAQYWNGTSFITHKEDSCTTLAAANIALGTYQTNLNACETSVTVGPFVSGRTTLQLSAPGQGNNGSVIATVNLGGNNGTTCVANAVVDPATGANIPYLQGNWTGAAYNQNPSGKATFGVYGGSDEVIFLRENF